MGLLQMTSHALVGAHVPYVQHLLVMGHGQIDGPPRLLLGNVNTSMSTSSSSSSSSIGSSSGSRRPGYAALLMLQNAGIDVELYMRRFI